MQRTDGSDAFKLSLLEELAGALAMGALLLLSPLFRPWYSRWGATDEEVRRPLPGDEIVPKPRLETTRSVTVHASAAQVWPWLAQMGQGRGGLYSYERLENLAGCQIHNADRVLPEYQEIKAGDVVRLGPEGYPAFSVAGVEPGKALILGGSNEKTGEAHSWVFFLEPLDERTTRLIVRGCTGYRPALGNTIIWRALTDPISFVMERKMMLGIQRRAEHYFHQQAAG